jgi:hypothetical protein
MIPNNEHYATAAPSEAIGKPLEEIVGVEISSAHDIISSMTREARYERLRRVFETGRADTAIFWQHLAGPGRWTHIIATAARIDHIDGAQYILNVAHDITDVDETQLFMRAPIFQQFTAVIANADGECIATTDGAGKLCGFANGGELYGKRIEDTAFQPMVVREVEKVAESRETGKPAHGVEWQLTEAGLFMYVVTRIALPKAAGWFCCRRLPVKRLLLHHQRWIWPGRAT